MSSHCQAWVPAGAAPAATNLPHRAAASETGADTTKRAPSRRTTLAMPEAVVRGAPGMPRPAASRAAPAWGPARPISTLSEPSSSRRTLERSTYIDSFLSIAAWMSADRASR